MWILSKILGYCGSDGMDTLEIVPELLVGLGKYPESAGLCDDMTKPVGGLPLLL
jgi:hypothetical protein